jgi:Zn-dependent protease
MSPWRDRRGWDLAGFCLLMAWFCLCSGWQMTAVILLVASIHELGHWGVLRLLGGRAGQFRLSPFGAELVQTGPTLSYPRELLAVLACPGANLFCAAALMLLPGGAGWRELAVGANVVLGVFNLLPAAPLDGWRGLQLLLCWLAGPDRGSRWAAGIGGAASLGLMAAILWLMVSSGGNLWLLPAAVGVGWSGAGELGRGNRRNIRLFS